MSADINHWLRSVLYVSFDTVGWLGNRKDIRSINSWATYLQKSSSELLEESRIA